MTNASDEPGPKSRWLQKLERFLFSNKNFWETINKPGRKKLAVFFNCFLSERSLTSSGAILLIIALSPWISEASVNKQIYADILKYSKPLDPVKAGEMCESLGKFTPAIQEKKDDIALNIMSNNSSYSLSQQLALNSGSKIKEPQRQEATYTVQKGETITQIAEKFSLHVATILDANKIKPEDTNLIQPGTVLKIPSSDTSDSLDWLVAVNKAAQEAKQKALDTAKKQQASKAMAASSSSYKTSRGYQGIDNSEIIVPISHNGISRGFSRGHNGIDYRAQIGTPVRAAASGRVVIISTGWSGGYGNQIIIDHGGGRATRYAHLSGFAISTGDNVSQGQIIGYSGNTGRSTGPHLHFELIINGTPVPPF